MEGENSLSPNNRVHPPSTVAPPGNGLPSIVPGHQQHPPQQPVSQAGSTHPPVSSGIQQHPPNVTPLLRPPVLQPGVQPQNHYLPQQQRQHVQQDPMMYQILQQLQQQQTTINQLLVQQQQSAEQQQQSFARQQQEIIRSALSAINVHVPANPEQILDSLASNIKEFRYEPEENITFSAWFTRYDDLFARDAARLDDQAKVRLLLRKIGTSEHDRYVSYILPKSPKDVNFADTVSKLKSLFGTPESVLSRRYRCLQLTKQATEDYKTFACRVNKLCVEFELRKLTEDQFKCLVFVCGLKQEGDSEVRTRLLSRIEENNEITLEQISDECQRLLNLKHDTAMIESAPSLSSVNAVRRSQQKGAKPPSPCWNCGSMHFVKDCPYSTHQCEDCGQFGHREDYCEIARKAKSSKRNDGSKQRFARSVHVNSVRSRRIFVTVDLNGVPVKLQLDTASDISVISEATWKKIGRPASSPASVEATTASGKPLNLQSQTNCDVTFNGVTRTARLFVVKQHLDLLGLDLIGKFNLWSVPINQFNTGGRESNDRIEFRKQNRKLSSFDCSSKVLIKLRSSNQWLPGIVRDRIGSTLYNVQLEDGRKVCIHINQMRSRSSSSSGESSSQFSDKPHNHPLPLDILLEAWNLPSLASTRTAAPSMQSSSSHSETPQASANSTSSKLLEQSIPLQKAAVPVETGAVRKIPTLLPALQDSAQSSSLVSSSSSVQPSTKASSAESMPAVETQASIQIPRRSARLRRPPVRYTPSV